MTTISEKLQTIIDSTSAIKKAIIEKGVTISGDITTWAAAISSIQNGGESSGGAGSIFKITNKLNGKLFGGPNYVTERDLLHTYNFEGGTLGSNVIIANYDPNNVGAEVFPSQKVWGTGTDYGAGVYSNGLSLLGTFYIYAKTNGEIHLYATGDATSTLACPLIYIAFDTNGNYDMDFFSLQTGKPCFVKNTEISLHNGTRKLVQDITYNDELLVWNFDEGEYDKAKPLWIKKVQISSNYYKCKLDNGTIVNLVGSNGKCHRLFSIEDGIFVSATDMVGKTTYTENGIAKVIACDLIQEKCEYYNIITDYHMNLFANGVLTSCRYNNLYPIQDMKFIKDNRLNRAPKWKLYENFRDHRSLDRFIDGLRLYEQLDISIDDTVKYCENLEALRKKLDDFDDNKELVKDIENTEVGWIDRDGKVYGFRLYMAGHFNHIILAEKICKELGIETNNPSLHLEKEGWLKYTTDFVLNSDDKEINDKQLKSLYKFLKTPNKLKKKGKIRIGNFMSPYVDVSEFNTMDKYSFEYRKKHNMGIQLWQQEK